MRIDRVMLAAPKSGSGKTMLTCGLLKLLTMKHKAVAAFKCGPDYIDPLFHRTMLGIASKNLDTFFTGPEETLRLFLSGCKEGDLAVLEGVMGLYDGLGGVGPEGSSYNLACVTKTPILLVVDAKGMGRSLVALIAGFLQLDVEQRIKGVILNRVSGPYYETLKACVEKELSVPVVGYVPNLPELAIESRHLGLTLPQEHPELNKNLTQVAEILADTLDLPKILAIAETAEALQEPEANEPKANEPEANEPEAHTAFGEDTPCALRLAVALDEAFCFCYEDNLQMLRNFGVTVTFFSPLRDPKLPDDVAGILLPGGYPELYGEDLSKNQPMLEALREADKCGVPIFAECGGFMYLHQWLKDPEGQKYSMVGIVPGGCVKQDRLVRFGYVELRFPTLSDLRIKGHEFHYYESEKPGEGAVATKSASGKQYPCMHVDETHILGYPHLYYPSSKQFATEMVKRMERYKYH